MMILVSDPKRLDIASDPAPDRGRHRRRAAV